MQFIKKSNGKTLIIMVMCGVGFYFIFQNLIEQNQLDQTYFIIKIAAEDLSDKQKETAMKKTLAVYQKRKKAINIPGTVVRQEDEVRLVIRIPGSMDAKQSERIKGILVNQENISYKLVVYGPIKK